VNFVKNIFIFLSLLACIGQSAYSAVITIPLEDPEHKLAPADDLVYAGAKISQLEAIKLKDQGIDLSELEPERSSLYQADKLTMNPIQNENKFLFHSLMTAPTEFFRFSVESQNKKYTITASLYNHQSLLRAALLRKIGYDVPTPNYLHSFKLKFESLIQKKEFIDQLVQSTLLSQKRWIKENREDSLELILKGMILEPSQIKNVPLYWPMMQYSRQKMRRTFRAMFYLYITTDFIQNINNVPWRVGKVFNNELVVGHQYAQEFSSITIDDFKWIHRKINNLTDNELEEVFKYSSYPKPIQLLLKEKFKSRVNHFNSLLYNDEIFPVDYKISSEGLFAGKLLKRDYSEYVPYFYQEDPQSPYRFSEMLKYFRSQMSYDSMSNLLDTAVKKFIPNIDTSDAVDEIKDKILNYGREHGEIPLKFWVFPTFGAEVSGNRSIVFGQYLANVAPIQLVDRIHYKLQAGLFGILSGLPSWIKPIGSLNASIQRSWSHVRAMPDLTTATQQKISKLLIPHLMQKLGKVISQDTSCSINDSAWVNEEIIGTMRTWVIYFDKENVTAKDQALKLREKLIQDNIPADQILLSAVFKEEICVKERTAKINKSIEDFIKEFAIDETFTITDSLVLNKRLGAKISIPQIDQLSADITVGRNKAKLRSYIIRKTSNGIEVTIQTQRNNTLLIEQGINFVMELVSNSNKWINGDMFSKVYKIKLTDITEEEKKLAINTLREIFVKGTYHLLEEYYNPTTLDSNAHLRTHTFSFLWRKSEKLRMQHEVEVVVANRPHNIDVDDTLVDTNPDFWEPATPPRVDIPLKERTRTLYSASSIKRVGNNFHYFLDRLLSNLTFDWLSLGATNDDPGRSVHGRSWKQKVVTESELSEGHDLNPTTKFELSYVGYKVKHRRLNKYLKQYEWLFSFEGSTFSIDRSLFNQMSRLKSYDLRANVIFYPSALEKIKNLIINNQNIEEVVQYLRHMYGTRRWDSRCREFFLESVYRACVPNNIRFILDLRKNGFSQLKKLKTIQINNLYIFLMNTLHRPRVLEFIGEENFLGSAYFSGYREGDSEGYLEHTTDTVGTYQEDFGTGLFDHFATVLGITAYTIKAMDYTQGM
jgi:hypothetical protein